MQTGLVVLISAIYLATIFAIAWWGDRLPSDKPIFRRASIPAALVYALTLGIHTTAWTFFGNVGRATDPGFQYLPATLGAVLFLIFGQRVLRHVIAVSKARNITSVADFISARFGKRRPLAAFVSLALFVGVLPYIALQLKAVGLSFDLLTGGRDTIASPHKGFPGSSDFWVAVTLAVFTMLFGIRHIHASERHRGFVLAVAFDSLVKLVAFLGVAVFIVYGMFDGLGSLFAQTHSVPALREVLVWNWTDARWYAATAAAVLCYLCLPQLFHVAVVENDDPASVRAAAVLYPAYVLAFIVFITPIALAGLIEFRELGDRVHPDTFMIALPLAADAPMVGLLAFIGGLSAAAGMIMVSAVALSTMLCNDVVLPFLLRGQGMQAQTDMTRVVLAVRRAMVVVILLLAFAIRRLIDEETYLVEIGIMSFIAAAQLAPAFFGGLYWRRASTAGVVTGLSLGFAIWVYALLLPSMASTLGLSAGFIHHGPWHIHWLQPQNLFGMGFADAVTNTLVWSLTLNVGAFVLVSLLRPATQADIDNALAIEHIAAVASEHSGRVHTLRELTDIAAQFVGTDHAVAAFGQYVKARSQRLHQTFDFATHADKAAIRFGETLIAGAIGAASARIVLAAALGSGRLSSGAARAALEDASAALREKHTLLRAITENVRQGICAFDAQLRISAWNSRFAQLLGLPQGTLQVGMPLADIVALNRARGEYTAEQLNLLIVNRDLRTLSWPYVYERTRPDGTVLEVSYNRMDIGGYVATYTDVTERHRAAQALRVANELLEQRVRERTLALEQAKMDAEHANADKTRFLAAASHDLLQPLSAARLFLSAQQPGLRERNAAGMDIATVASYTDSALSALESTEGLLTELLYMSSLDARAITPVFQSTAIGSLLTQLVAEFAPLAARRGLELRAVPTALAARTDPGLLRRVLQNFISNAIRYTANGRVVIGCRRHGAQLRIEVWDTGIGIPEDSLGEIFREFHRLADDTTECERGAGLGLAIADRIARLLDATLTVRSRLGHGSVFAIQLPRAAVSAAACAPGTGMESVPVDAQGLLILCIDNDARIRDGMKALLERWGHRAVCAHDLTSARRCLDDATPDAALIDYHLDGGSNGLDVLAALRRLWMCDVPVIIITADRSASVHDAARAAGCVLLQKPVKPAALRRCVNNALQHRKVAGEIE